ncbi:tRNA (adenosine(37)-N6)-dimethylallyltransferase MiaA [Elongatibacter sediminis]|uniref:tRNA dimethylallyltransferase n=1 Tax=Elongatibacter sediminis TaxID=3119006 RepID=A0AAW9RD40_9GAMM
MPSSSPPVIFLMGPTASGKTGLAVALHERFPVDIISVDSALVYRGMDIGTAKPDAATLVRAPHRLIDIRDPAESYSAAEFREDALAEMAQIHRSGRVPLLVGGTMLYFRALSGGLAPMPPADAGLRRKFEEDARRLGWAALHERLAERDPVIARRIHPNDPQRIQRALEVIEITGRPMSEIQREHRRQAEDALGCNVLRLVVCPESRRVLHQRIERRFRIMLEAGLIDEVRALRERGDLTPDLPSMRCVGYRQVWRHLEGKTDPEEMVEEGVAATRQLAKRQLTWLRQERQALWYDLATDAALESVFDDVGAFLAASRP